MVRKGRRIAIDYGDKRIGVAVSDYHGILCSPLITLDGELPVEENLTKILDAVEGDILEIYCGLPLGLSGKNTPSTAKALDFAKQLQELTSIPVYLVDERLSTSLVNARNKEIGKTQKESRSTIDQMAAVAILQQALEIEINQGIQPGVRIGNATDV